MLFLQKDHLKLIESKVEKTSMFRDLYSTFFLIESLDLERGKIVLIWVFSSLGRLYLIRANILVTFCIICSFSSGSKLCYHSSDWSRGGIHSPPEPHAVDDSGCISRSTYPRDPASPHRDTGNSLSNPHQHPRTSACTNRDPAASAGRKDFR